MEPHPQSNDPISVEQRANFKVYLNIILPLFITSIIAYLDRQNLSYAALTMNKDLGFSETMYGFGAGIFFAGYILFEIPGALIAERYSPKWWLARIMISWGILTFLLAFVTNAWQFCVLRFLIGAAEASLYPVIYASVIPRWFVTADRARAIAILLASLQISSIVGAPIAGWLVGVRFFQFEGWQALFILEAIPAVLFGPVLVYWMADTPEQAPWLLPDEKQYLMDKLQADSTGKQEKQHYSVSQALSNPEVLKLCLIYFLWITGYWGLNYWMPTVLKAASGMSNMQVGWLIVVPMTLSLIVMLWVGDHSSKTGEKRWHGALGLFLAAAGILLGTMFSNPYVSFVCMCMVAIGVYAPMGVWWSYPTTFLTGAAAAGAIGLINSFGSIGGFVGPFLIGYLKSWTGSHTVGWLYLAASMALAGLLILTCKREPAQDNGSI